MEQTVQDQSGAKAVPPLLDKAWKYFIFGLFVVVTPIFDFSFSKLLKPEWQDGRFSSRINLSLQPESSAWFFVLLAYAIFSYLLLLWNTDHYARLFMIRLGVYTGAFLALQYSILVMISNEPVSLLYILGYFLPVFAPRIYRWLISRWNESLIKTILVGISASVLVIPMIVWREVLSPFLFLVFLVGMAAPFWCFLIAWQASRWLWANHESAFTLPRRFGILAWLAAYGSALRFNILKTIELYNALPTQPPNCYIATAAAKGHARIVGSWSVKRNDGTAMRVNRQLQRLKVVELAIMAMIPSVHALMRRIYDVVGRRLAAHIQNPLLADVAFLLLLPLEWISFFGLKLLIPEIHIVTKHLYRSSPQGDSHA